MEKALERREFVEKTKFSDDINLTKKPICDEEPYITPEQEKENIEKLLASLKILFNTCQVDALIRKMVEETKKPDSPELQIFMGEDYQYFQLLQDKKRVDFLFRRFRHCAQMGMTFDCDSKELRNLIIETKKENCYNEKPIDEVNHVLIENEAHMLELRSNPNVLPCLRRRREKFKTVMNFWKIIDDSHIEGQLLEAMNEPASAKPATKRATIAATSDAVTNVADAPDTVNAADAGDTVPNVSDAADTVQNVAEVPDISIPDKVAGGDPVPCLATQSSGKQERTLRRKKMLWILLTAIVIICCFVFVIPNDNWNAEVVEGQNYQNMYCSLCHNLETIS